MNRAIADIAAEISQTWKPVHYAAKPYLAAMHSLGTLSDSYGADDARGIVLYFLSNARTWKGDDARRIKAELNRMLKGW
jgi:hypothetical protein